MRRARARLAVGSIMLAAVGLALPERSRALADPMGLWRFDDGQGEVAADDTRNGNDGHLRRGVDWSANGKVGGALVFDGTTGSVRFNLESVAEHVFVLHRDTDATVMFWVRTFSADHASILWTRSDSADQGRFNIYSGTGEAFGFDYRPVDGKVHSGFPASELPLDTWMHLAITRAGDVHALYRNGRLEGSAEDDDRELPIDPKWTISGREGFRFHGMIDELVVFEVALTKAEILRNVPRTVSRRDKLATAWAMLKTP